MPLPGPCPWLSPIYPALVKWSRPWSIGSAPGPCALALLMSAGSPQSGPVLLQSPPVFSKLAGPGSIYLGSANRCGSWSTSLTWRPFPWVSAHVRCSGAIRFTPGSSGWLSSRCLACRPIYPGRDPRPLVFFHLAGCGQCPRSGVHLSICPALAPRGSSGEACKPLAY